MYYSSLSSLPDLENTVRCASSTKCWHTDSNGNGNVSKDRFLPACAYMWKSHSGPFQNGPSMICWEVERLSQKWVHLIVRNKSCWLCGKTEGTAVADAATSQVKLLGVWCAGKQRVALLKGDSAVPLWFICTSPSFLSLKRNCSHSFKKSNSSAEFKIWKSQWSCAQALFSRSWWLSHVPVFNWPRKGGDYKLCLNCFLRVFVVTKSDSVCWSWGRGEYI